MVVDNLGRKFQKKNTQFKRMEEVTGCIRMASEVEFVSGLFPVPVPSREQNSA